MGIIKSKNARKMKAEEVVKKMKEKIFDDTAPAGSGTVAQYVRPKVEMLTSMRKKF